MACLEDALFPEQIETMFDPTDSSPDHMNHVVSGLRPGWEEKERDGEKEKKYSYVSDRQYKKLKVRKERENARKRAAGIYIPQATKATTLLPWNERQVGNGHVLFQTV